MGEDDVPAVSCIQPLRDLAATVLEGLGRVGARQMLGAVNIGGAIGVVMADRVQQGLGFLRSGGAVQIGLVLPLQGGDGRKVDAPGGGHKHGVQDSYKRAPVRGSLVASSRCLVVSVQRFVQFDGRFVGFALHGTGLGVTAEQQVRLAGQLTRLDHFNQLVALVEQRNLGPGGDVQARFHGVAVAQRDTDTGVGADQATFADLDHDVAATRQGAHGGATAAQVRAFADKYACRDTAFDHAWAFGAAVEVDETFVHHGGAFAHVGAQADTRSISDTHAAWYDVFVLYRDLVHREHFQQLATQARFQLAFGQLIDVDRALAGPGHVRQLREYTGQAQAVGLDQAMGQQVQL